MPMEQEKIIAQFTVTISSAEDATWQGVVTAEDKTFVFKSEMQLLKWLWETYPALIPDSTQPLS